MINIKINKNKSWNKYTKNNLNLWINGYIYSHKIEKIIEICGWGGRGVGWYTPFILYYDPRGVKSY